MPRPRRGRVLGCWTDFGCPTPVEYRVVLLALDVEVEMLTQDATGCDAWVPVIEKDAAFDVLVEYLVANGSKNEGNKAC